MDITKDESGHWIGKDGFVCPLTFAEFYERFDDYGRNMAVHLFKRATDEQRDDLQQEIWHLLIKNRVIEKFDPTKRMGACKGQFFGFVNLCTRRLAINRWEVRIAEPTIYGIDGTVDDEDSRYTSTGTMTEEDINSIRAVPVSVVNLDDKLYVEGFKRYLVTIGRPELLATMMAMLLVDTQADAAPILGVTRQAISVRMRALRKLAKKYETQHKRVTK